MKVVLITLSLAAAAAVMGHAEAAKAPLFRDASIGECPIYSNKEDLDKQVSVFSSSDNILIDFLSKLALSFVILENLRCHWFQ